MAELTSPSSPLPPEPNGPITEPVRVRGIFGVVDALLRDPRRVTLQLADSGSVTLIGSMFVAALYSLLIYGTVAGSFSGGMQLWAAPVKIAGGLLFSAIICFPSLYIFACLAGLRAGMREVLGMIAGMLAILAVLLIGLAPIAWVFSQSTESVFAMGALHIVFGIVAYFFGMHFLSGSFAYFKAESRAGMNLWILIFMLVVLQMTTALRPIIDTAPTLLPTEKKFFIAHWIDCLNAPPKPPAEAKK